MSVVIPPALAAGVGDRQGDAGRRWLATLGGRVDDARARWALRIDEPFTPGGATSWAAPVRSSAPHLRGEPLVLKMTWPHREAVREGDVLRHWAGRGAVRLYDEHLDADGTAARLVEQCRPGTPLADPGSGRGADAALAAGLDVAEQLWLPPPRGHAYDDLATVLAGWADLAEERAARYHPGWDPGVVAEGIGLLRSLPSDPVARRRQALLHGDLHPGNILRAERAPWLAIDPKPVVGDPGYDVVPLVEQVPGLLDAPDPAAELRRRVALVGDRTGLDAVRLSAWIVARRVESALWHLATGDPAGAEEAFALASLAATSVRRP